MTAGDPRPSFVDTNVFVYAVNDDDPERQAIARELLGRLVESEVLQTSTQVLQELYVVLTRKVQRKFTAREALAYLDRIARSPVIGIDYGSRSGGVVGRAHAFDVGCARYRCSRAVRS